MEKHIPYEKLSKKKQREINAQKRGSWGGIDPVTRKPKNSKAYDRSKAGQWKKEYHDLSCFYIRGRVCCLWEWRQGRKPYQTKIENMYS